MKREWALTVSTGDCLDIENLSPLTWEVWVQNNETGNKGFREHKN